MSTSSVKDNGSNFKRRGFDKPNVPRSVFDLSYLNSFTAEQCVLTPVYTQHSLPREDYSFGVEALCRVVNPPVVPLMSRQRIFFHTFWCSYTQLFKSAQIMFDHGRLMMSPPENVVMPTFSIPRGNVAERGSLFDYLGFNIVNENSGDSELTVEIPAIKFMMYLKIWRDYYCNKRIFSAWLKKQYASTSLEWYKILGDFLFPADDEDFRIGSSQWNDFISNADCLSFFTELKYRNWTDDYFTTMQITPLYAEDVPSIDFANTLKFVDAETSVAKKYPNGYNGIQNPYGFISDDNKLTPYALSLFENKIGRLAVLNDPVGSVNVVPQIYDSSTSSSASSQSIALNATGKSVADMLNNTVSIVDSEASAHTRLTIDKIRECLAETLILEKLAKTDGTYSEYALAMFGERPASARDMRPTYVGGTYQPIIFSQVLSNIPTSVNGRNIPQGTATGLGLSSADGYIGSHHSDDYGLYMTIMSIMPDTYYCQGLQREDTYQTSDDFYLPDRAGLGMQAVMLQELYNCVDSDNILLGYAQRFDELRYRANEVHGKVADPNNESFSPYIQTRYFMSKPTLSPELISTKDNVPKKWLSSTEEVPYILQIANKVRAVRPVPYEATPATLGM